MEECFASPHFKTMMFECDKSFMSDDDDDDDDWIRTEYQASGIRNHIVLRFRLAYRVVEIN